METTDIEISKLDRQNILNNVKAIKYVQQYLSIPWWDIWWTIYFTLKQVAEFFDVDTRTIERYIEKYWDELKSNWYEILTGERLKQAKMDDVSDIYVGNKTPKIWVFNFRSFLDLWMLLTESENAKELRKVILNIVMDFINKKAWWSTKYINLNDEQFLDTYKNSLFYRKELTDALKNYVRAWNIKYAYFTNLIYQTIFKENSNEYKKLLKLKDNENLRHTFYSEILNIVSAYENWFADALKKQWKKISFFEAKELFDNLKNSALMKPIIERARQIMASRDKAFRDVIHENIIPYIKAVPEEEYEKFLYDNSENVWKQTKEFIHILDENKDVLQRLWEK